MRKVSSGKISVIIPVHNAEKYIAKAVQSVIEQSYTNWELLLIENGSEDASLDICKKNAEKDSRIQVLKEKNKGAGSARNTGLCSAEGEYIVFIDADDYLPDKSVFQRYMNIAKQIRADIIVSNYVRLWNGKILPAAGHDSFSVYSPDSEEFRFEDFFQLVHCHMSGVNYTKKLFWMRIILYFPILNMQRTSCLTCSAIFAEQGMHS